MPYLFLDKQNHDYIFRKEIYFIVPESLISNFEVSQSAITVFTIREDDLRRTVDIFVRIFDPLFFCTWKMRIYMCVKAIIGTVSVIFLSIVFFPLMYFLIYEIC